MCSIYFYVQLFALSDYHELPLLHMTVEQRVFGPHLLYIVYKQAAPQGQLTRVGWKCLSGRYSILHDAAEDGSVHAPFSSVLL